MNKREKALAKLQRRVKGANLTIERQGRNNFRPNATGGMHQVHIPGSMNRRRQG